MLTLDVCVEPLFTKESTEERIARIGACGYKSVELWLHDATFDGSDFDFGAPRDAKAIRQACEAAGMTLNNLVVNPPDDGTIGGAPVIAATRAKYLERVEATIAFAKAAGCSKAITCAGDEQPGMSRPAMRAAVEEALGAAAEIAARNDFTLLLEPLNTRVDHIGYSLNSSEEAAYIVRSIGSPNLRLLYDVYHMQVMEGDVVAHLRAAQDVIGHYHSAGVPGRAEHVDCELNYPFILKAVAETGYAGSFGLEYFPATKDHAASLKAVRDYLMLSGVCE